MLRISKLTLARGAKRLLEDASATVFPGHRVGLVGPNGCGKSSLFGLIRGKNIQDAGDVSLPPAWVIAHVAQETPSSDRTALEYALDGDVELRDLEIALEEAYAAPSDDHEGGMALAELHHRFEHIGGYAARARAGALLAGLGFPQAEQERKVAEFSGGWRMRLNLAQALMCRSDLLLLDEPTNHLDLDAVMWLEDWLASYPGTLLLITHDRDFLDAVVKSIIHVDKQKLNEYTGNYSAFETARAMQFSLQASAYAKQQKQIAHLQSFVDRFKAKATKAKQAQSRVKTLERMEVIAAAHVDSPFEFSFREPEHQPRQLMHLKEAKLGYESRTILEKVDWRLFYGDKIGLLGPNGAGKSTLVKSIAGTLALKAGERLEADNGRAVKIGYFAQHQVEQLRVDESAIQHMKRLDPQTREQEFRNFLGGFDFRGANADAAVGPFSGGEKARLALAMIVWQKPNLLLLDEPTNHLDIEMREAVAEALQAFEGTLVVVAHDRHLLKATTDQLWLVAHGKLEEFDGDLDDYKVWSKTYQSQQNSGSAAKGAAKKIISIPVPVKVAEVAVTPAGNDKKARKVEEAVSRQRTSETKKPQLVKLGVLEAEMKKLSTEKADVEQWLGQESAYADENKAQLQRMLTRQIELATLVTDAEWKWLELSEKLEQ